MTGRRSTYTEEIAADICEWIANGGSLREWCDQDGHPTFHAVYDWLEKQEGFAEAYARARERQAHNDADRINQIASQIASGALKPDQGRVMMDALKWTASKRLARLYGDRLVVGGDQDGAPLIVSWAGGEKL
jgi:hypothetical protein